MTTSEVEVRSDGAVRVITLNRPDAKNAVNEPMHSALARVWVELGNDPGARVVVLTGAGSSFCAGGDTGWMTALREDGDKRTSIMAEANQVVRSLLDCTLPVIAAVNGPAVGLGCTLAVLADLAVIAEDAYLSDPHVNIGLVAGDGGAVVWPLVVGLHRARKILFTGGKVTAADALDFGLAASVSAPGQTLDDALTLAYQLAKQPPQALQSTKRAVNLHLTQALDVVLPYGIDAETASFASAEHSAALAAMATRAAAR